MRGNFTYLKTCLACGSSQLKRYLDLGWQPLANDFSSNAEEMEEFPLEINLCKECFHSQLVASVSPSRLFSHYVYISGTTKTLKDYFLWLNEKIRLAYKPGARILDLASNDGSFLEISQKIGFKILGVDPASNLIGLAAEKQVPTICDYWPSRNLDCFEYTFDVIVAMNVLAHVPNPLEFLESARRSLKKNGRIYIQTSQAKMFANGEFDTVYHEHLSFFTARSMKTLAKRAGLDILEGEYVPVHGISYLWTLVPSSSAKSSNEDSTIESLEVKEGLYDENTFVRFASSAQKIARDAFAKVEELRALGFQIWGYGAAAKGNTFINFSGIKLDGIIDDNPLKQGLISPGGKTLVHSIEKVAELEGKILFIIPAWNFADEIIDRLRAAITAKNVLALTYFPELFVRSIT